MSKLWKWIIPLAIEIILFGLFLLAGYKHNELDPAYKYIYINALGSSGLIMLLFSLFIFVTQEGVFDIVIYGTKKFFKYLLSSRRDENRQTYIEYVEEKRDRKKVNLWPSIIISLLPLVIYFILTITNTIV